MYAHLPKSMITKPYYRILRLPEIHWDSSYVLDARYAADRQSLIRSYHTLESDLKRFFEYVEPTDANLASYSVRAFELLLRAATEFETNATSILIANGYSQRGDHLTIMDYWLINRATRLSEYKVRVSSWAPCSKILTPFQEWSADYLLPWYTDYNTVKHDRSKEFPLAKLENVVTAVCAVFCILFAQFGEQVYNPYNEQDGYSTDNNDEDESGFIYADNSLFSVNPYRGWQNDDLYSFNWLTLKEETEPFQKFTF